VYPWYRRFLPNKHPRRKKGKHFNGEIEIWSKPTRRTGDDVFDMVKDLRVIFGKSIG
jgi:hypothetical protein